MFDESHHIGKYKDEYGEYDLYYDVAKYDCNDRIALDINCADNGSYARATVNLTDVDIWFIISNISFEETLNADDYAFINGDLTEDFKAWLREKNIISDPIATVKYNFGQYELCKILVK